MMKLFVQVNGVPLVCLIEYLLAASKFSTGNTLCCTMLYFTMPWRRDIRHQSPPPQKKKDMTGRGVNIPSQQPPPPPRESLGFDKIGEWEQCGFHWKGIRDKFTFSKFRCRSMENNAKQTSCFALFSLMDNLWARTHNHWQCDRGK